MGPLPWKVMGYILKSWDNDHKYHHKSEGLPDKDWKQLVIYPPHFFS